MKKLGEEGKLIPRLIVILLVAITILVYYWNLKPSGDNARYSQPSSLNEINRSTSYSRYPSNTFRSNNCTDDCSGHEAGYQWAEEHDIDDPDECDGNSDSFIEGCRSYAEERQSDLNDDVD